MVMMYDDVVEARLEWRLRLDVEARLDWRLGIMMR